MVLFQYFRNLVDSQDALWGCVLQDLSYLGDPLPLYEGLHRQSSEGVNPNNVPRNVSAGSVASWRLARAPTSGR